MAERVSRLEWQQEGTERRLNDGAKTFTQIQTTQKELAKQVQGKPTPWWHVAGIVITVVVLIGAWIWQAARYPDRAEFNSAQQKQERRHQSVDSDLSALKLEQVRIRGDINSIKASQARTEKGVEAIKKSLVHGRRR